jgi:mono/diheme cytochrome c family protein
LKAFRTEIGRTDVGPVAALREINAEEHQPGQTAGARRRAPMARRRFIKGPGVRGVGVIAVAMAVLGAPPLSAEARAQEARGHGRDLVQVHCARCHAVEAEDLSPLPAAPAFRTLSRNYPISALEEALAEGILTGHPEMPQLAFAPDDVAAIVAYIESIQER